MKWKVKKNRKGFHPEFPDQFIFAHKYCTNILQLLTNLLRAAEDANLFSVNINLASADDGDKLAANGQKDLIDNMLTMGYTKEVDDLLFRAPIPALLADMIEFIHESLDCSRRAWLIPSYALLRKPLKESLFYFESMLADKPAFLNAFRSDKWYHFSAAGAQSFSNHREKMSKEERIELISKAMGKTQAGNWVDAEFIADIRYDRKLSFCLAEEFDIANHLVTSYRGIRTSSENFNFIFSGAKERYSQWRHLYNTLPILMFHMYQVVFSLIESIGSGIQESNIFLPDILLKSGLYLWYFNTEYWAEWGNPFSSILSKDEFENALCKKCGKKVLETHMDIETVYNTGELCCCKCKHPFKYALILVANKLALHTGKVAEEK